MFGTGIEFSDELVRRFRIWSSTGRVGLLKRELTDDIDFLSGELKTIPKDKLYAQHDNVYYLLEYIKLTKKLIEPNKYGFWGDHEKILCFGRGDDVVMIAPIIISPVEILIIPFDDILKERPSSAWTI